MSEELQWYENIVFWTGLTAWFLAQSIKLMSHLVRTGRVDFNYLVSTGGMPSAHSALVSSLATAVAFTSGLQSPLFAVTAAFAIIVMFDAQTVRRAAGTQARLLNQMIEELFKEHHLSQQKLAEFLGHTPLQVYAGMSTGILVGLAMHFMFG